MLPEINTKSGRHDAHPQQRQTENARLLSALPSKPSNGVGVETLLQLHAKRQPVHLAKCNLQIHGTLPHMTNKGQPTKVPAKRDQRPKTSRFNSIQQKLPEHTKSPSSKQEQQRQFKGLALPMVPADVLNYFGKALTEFEQEEVLNYTEIWYMSLKGQKTDGSFSKDYKSGYVYESGTDKMVVQDHIAYRFEVLDMIGKGTFGQVFKCLDHKTNEMVAIKVIRNEKRFHHQAMVELKVLDALRKKDRKNSYNVIHMKEYFYFRDHLCITFELLGPNLYELQKKNQYRGFSQALVRRITKAVLKCLKMLNNEKIIHCDLKPENILLSPKRQGGIKVIDFGSSCYEYQRVYTYIQSRFYRSPEVILGHSYTTSIDMWSLGCILVELYTGFPLFPGENEAEQLACMMEVLDLPPADFLDTAPRKKLFFDSRGNPFNTTNSKGQKRIPGSRNLDSVLKTSNKSFLDFIKGCFMWDPKTRLTPEKAMQHPWIHGGHNKSQPKILPLRKVAECQSSMDIHINLAYLKAGYRAVEKPQFNRSEKSREESHGQTKPVSVKRLQPVGASAEEQNEEGNFWIEESVANRGHIVNKAPQDSTSGLHRTEQF